MSNELITALAGVGGPRAAPATGTMDANGQFAWNYRPDVQAQIEQLMQAATQTQHGGPPMPPGAKPSMPEQMSGNGGQGGGRPMPTGPKPSPGGPDNIAPPPTPTQTSTPMQALGRGSTGDRAKAIANDVAAADSNDDGLSWLEALLGLGTGAAAGAALPLPNVGGAVGGATGSADMPPPPPMPADSRALVPQGGRDIVPQAPGRGSTGDRAAPTPPQQLPLPPRQVEDQRPDPRRTLQNSSSGPTQPMPNEGGGRTIPVAPEVGQSGRNPRVDPQTYEEFLRLLPSMISRAM